MKSRTDSDICTEALGELSVVEAPYLEILKMKVFNTWSKYVVIRYLYFGIEKMHI